MVVGICSIGKFYFHLSGLEGYLDKFRGRTTGIKEKLGVLTWLPMDLCQLLCSNLLLMNFLQFASLKIFNIL